MDENNKSVLARITKPIGFSDTTGMNIYQSYTARSGFNYMVGMREVHDILIVEKIAEGTACTFLCGILIYHKKTNELLKEVEVARNVHYTRDKAMELVEKSLYQLVIEACGKNKIEIEEDEAKKYVHDILDKCYFDTSRKTIINWAFSAGIIKKENFRN